MRFHEINEVWHWCEEHAVELGPERRPTVDARFRVVRREVYAFGEPSGEEPRVARELLAELGAWDECLLWIVTWGVWSSTEDWPEFYAARGRLGEKRELAVAPGLLAHRDDVAILVEFVTKALRYGWDAHLFPVSGGVTTRRRAFLSHDEWVEVRERSA